MQLNLLKKMHGFTKTKNIQIHTLLVYNFIVKQEKKSKQAFDGGNNRNIWIWNKSFTYKIRHNHGTKDDAQMKFGAATKRDKRNVRSNI